MPYRPTPSVEARLQDNRERILQAARDLVREGGWQQAQVASVAAAAGMATGTVYRYFPSKADLFAEVLSLVSQREVDVVAAIVDADGPAGQRLVDCITTFSLRAMHGRRLAYALIAEPCEPAIDLARLAYRKALADQIARVIRQGIAAGEFIDVDAHLAASCVTGAFMEALVGPLAPECEPASSAAQETARAIAFMAARMLFRQLPRSLSLVRKGAT